MLADRLSLRVNFSWTLVGNSVYSASQWGLIVVMAKLGSPELVGLYSLALAVTTPVFMFTFLGLSNIQATDVQAKNTFGDYLGLRLLCSLLGVVFIAGILGVAGYKGDVAIIIALVSLSKLLESISDVSYGLMQKQERLDLIARSLMLRGILSLVVIPASLSYFHSLAVALAMQVIVWGGLMWFYDLPNVRRWQQTSPRFDFRTLINLLWLALPLGIVAGLNSLSTQVPRYSLERIGGQRELGIFSAIAAIGAVGNLITYALSRSALPRLSHLYAQGRIYRFIRLLLQLMGMGAFVGALGIMGAVFWGKPFLSLVYTAEYATYTDVLLITMVSIAVSAVFTFVGTAVTATQQFAVQALIHIIKVTSIGIACFVLVPQWRSLGAAWAVLIGSLVSCFMFSFMLWMTLKKAEIR